ncbi:MAG: DUF2189 domain-containing protein [Cocleimonas sp.]
MNTSATSEQINQIQEDKLQPSIRVRKITNDAPSRWLSKGIDDFKTAGLSSLLYGLLFAIAGAITIWYTRSNPIFVMAIVTGLYLVGPPVASGIYDMSQRIEQGEKPSLLHAISVLGKNTRCLLGLTVILGALMIAWTGVATLIVNAFFGDSSGFGSGLSALFTGDQSLPFTGILLIGGLLLALIASALSFTFLPLLSHKRMGTITVLAILTIIMFAWVRMMVLAINTFIENSTTIASGWDALINNPQFSGFMLVFMLVGMLFAAIAFTLSVIAVPLIIDRRVNVFTAISTSAKAVKKNPVPMFRWAATIAVLIAVGMGLFFIGLAIAMPVIGHASWHAYREIIVDE